MRIIDGDVLFEDLKECMKDSRLTPLQINGIALAATRIFEQPTIKPERPKGHWINDEDCYICSECQSVYGWWADSQVSNYCPNCGANMRGLE